MSFPSCLPKIVPNLGGVLVPFRATEKGKQLRFPRRAVQQLQRVAICKYSKNELPEDRL